MNPYETPKAQTPPPIPQKKQNRLLWMGITFVFFVILPAVIMGGAPGGTPAEAGRAAGGGLVIWMLVTLVCSLLSLAIRYKWAAIGSMLLALALIAGSTLYMKGVARGVEVSSKDQKPEEKSQDEREASVKLTQLETERAMMLAGLQSDGWKRIETEASIEGNLYVFKKAEEGRLLAINGKPTRQDDLMQASEFKWEWSAKELDTRKHKSTSDGVDVCIFTTKLTESENADGTKVEDPKTDILLMIEHGGGESLEPIWTF